ncbi:DUF4260 family protein [Micromonospora sp. NPDC049171]|uniref:DUF4260 family protein n=1 Tax=Micromonospora sp. NPDC049171 TaxID=3155770 RepID=UPI0033C69DAE
MTSTESPASAPEPRGRKWAPARPSPDVVAGTPGVVTGRPLTWLRIEGLTVAGAALVVFATTGQPWWLVPALFLVPDQSWLAYAGFRHHRRALWLPGLSFSLERPTYP